MKNMVNDESFWKDMHEGMSDLVNKRGKILDNAIVAEATVAREIMEFYDLENNEHFFDCVMSRISFDGKVRIFSDICKSNGAKNSDLKAFRACVDFIRNTRNDVAHSIFATVPKLIPHENFRKTDTRNIVLTDDLVEEIGQKITLMILAIDKLREDGFLTCRPKL